MKFHLEVFFAVLILAKIVSQGESQGDCGYWRGVVRLQGGQNGREGRVEVCNDGIWGQVCGRGWDDHDARVICRQLGLLTLNTVAVAVSGSYFGGVESTGVSWLDDVGCTGSEETVVNCLTAEQQRSQWQVVQCDTSAGILCLESDDGHTLRLVGGRNEREGRVEVYHGGQWGAVCMGDTWGAQEATVVCRQLGLADNGVIATSGDQFVVRGATAAVLLDGFQCSESETNLFLCQEGTWGGQNCSVATAGVVCTPQTGDCSEGVIRLVGGRTEREGRVETCHGGVWGTVCSGRGRTWTDTDADIVCRQLGFQEQNERGSQVTDSAQYGSANGVIWHSTTNCGSLPCTPQEWVNSDCLHTDDVAVTCPDLKEQLQFCVNIEPETLLLFETFHAIYNSVSAVIVSGILSNCSRLCSYSVHDMSIDVNWSSPTLPSSMCVTHHTTLLVRLTCSYRPHLNENDRVQIAATNALSSIGHTIDCDNYGGYAVMEDIDFVDCRPPKSTSVLQVNSLSGRVNSTVNLMSATKSKDISSQLKYEKPLHTTSAPSRRGMSRTMASMQISVKQTAVAIDLTSTTGPSSLNISTSAAATPVPDSDSPVTVQSTEVLAYSRSYSLDVDSTIIHSLSNSVTVPEVPRNEEDGISINWFMAFLAGLLVGCVVLLVVSMLICTFLYKKRQEKRHLSSGDNTLSRTCGRNNSVRVSSVDPLVASTPSSPDTCYYEDIDYHEYATLEQTLSLQQPRQQDNSQTQSSGCLSNTGHKYAVLTGPERTPDVAANVRLENCVPDDSPSTIPEYATLDPELRVLPPDSANYSKLYIGNHDYQHVLPDPSNGYDRTFAL